MKKTKKLRLQVAVEKIRNLVISELKQAAGASADPCSEPANNTCTTRPQ
jgi:hypothetical protein